MCKVLGISKSGFYKYKEKSIAEDLETKRVVRIFKDNQRAYGTRRIQKECEREGIVISRRRIRNIMHENDLISTYTIAHYKVHKQAVNEDRTKNEVDRQFDGRALHEVIVSDLTYVRVNGVWNYICILLDLHNREIIGYSCGRNKNAELVERAFAKVKSNLSLIDYFHTDRGMEFKNKLIENLLNSFGITRSLSVKGTPYDNAVAEATFKSIKTEFVFGESFGTLNELENKFGAFVWWFNNKRLHSTLGYLTPVEYRVINSI